MKKFYKDLDEIKESEVNFTRDDIFDDIDLINIEANNFVLTGTFTSGKRKDIENLIKKYAGKIQKKPTSSTDYLVVGDVVNENWKYGNYGTKIEQVLSLKKDGHPIKIIPEQRLLKNIGSNTPIETIDIYKDELFKIFLTIPEKRYYEMEDYLTGEKIIIDIDDKIENSGYVDFIFSKLKGRAKNAIFHLSLIKYAYNQLTEQEKFDIQIAFKDKLITYIDYAVSKNLANVKNNIDFTKNLGPFTKSKYVQKRLLQSLH